MLAIALRYPTSSLSAGRSLCMYEAGVKKHCACKKQKWRGKVLRIS